MHKELQGEILGMKTQQCESWVKCWEDMLTMQQDQLRQYEQLRSQQQTQQQYYDHKAQELREEILCMKSQQQDLTLKLQETEDRARGRIWDTGDWCRFAGICILTCFGILCLAKEGAADLGFLGAMYQSICALGRGNWECYVGACFFLGGCAGVFYTMEKFSRQEDARLLHVIYTGTRRAKARIARTWTCWYWVILIGLEDTMCSGVRRIRYWVTSARTAGMGFLILFFARMLHAVKRSTGGIRVMGNRFWASMGKTYTGTHTLVRSLVKGDCRTRCALYIAVSLYEHLYWACLNTMHDVVLVLRRVCAEAKAGQKHRDMFLLQVFTMAACMMSLGTKTFVETFFADAGSYTGSHTSSSTSAAILGPQDTTCASEEYGNPRSDEEGEDSGSDEGYAEYYLGEDSGDELDADDCSHELGHLFARAAVIEQLGDIMPPDVVEAVDCVFGDDDIERHLKIYLAVDSVFKDDKSSSSSSNSSTAADRETILGVTWAACHTIGWAIIMLWNKGFPIHDTILKEWRSKPEDRRILGYGGFQTAREYRMRLQDRDPQLLRINWDKFYDDLHDAAV